MKSVAVQVLALTLGLVAGGAPAEVKPSPWEKDIAAFETADQAAPRPGVSVLFYGSSSFRLWSNLWESFPGLDLLNRGFGGSQLSDLNEYLDRVVVPHSPHVLLIYGGDNDIAAGKSAEVVLHDFQELVRRVRRALPGTRIAFVAIKPSPSREKFLSIQQEANARIRRFAGFHRLVDFVDAATPLLTKEGLPDPQYFLEDRLHLNPSGYEVWRGVLSPYLQRWALSVGKSDKE